MARIGCQSLGNDEQRISKSRNTPFCFALDRLLEQLALQMSCACDLESSSSWHNASVDNHIVHTPQTIADSVLDLSNSVRVWSLDQQCDRLWLLDFFLHAVSTCIISSHMVRLTMNVYFSSPAPAMHFVGILASGAPTLLYGRSLWREYGNKGSTAVTFLALAVLQACIVIKSSIK